MGIRHGDFIWYELMTTDADAAEAFYGGLLGWSFRPAAAAGGSSYRLISRQGRQGPEAGGLMELTANMRAGGARPIWAGYVGVDDVDETARLLTRTGGAILMDPTTIEGVGRMAFVRDPLGAPFYIMRGASQEESHAFAQDEPREGHCAWNELHSTDPGAALTFYRACFGWEVVDSMDMGSMGSYEMLRNPPHESLLGAVMRAREDGPPPIWHFYFRVPDIDAALHCIGAEGGTVRGAPQEIPGGEFALNATDPQGAAFSLIGKRAG